ncbi:SH3 and cysteine-rich domain-containing protein isoform X3 [Tachypleus tridentatus]|uniref:SH3 and cysteine-rich domain-containing protein isoform X3 n=1 Tax=Tachypleus tridentatus TaxID=6853 RepID=UPI003FCFC8F3
MASGGEVPFRELVSPGLNQPLQDHNVLTFRLVKTVADFTQHLSTIHERHAEELQILVENFRKRNAELRRERPPYQNSLFASWEVFLQEVEVDSQVHGDIARSLGRQVGMTLLEKTFHRKIQSRKIFLHRESFETVLSKAENLLSKCHQDYSDAYRKLLTVRNHSQLAEYYDMHNAYVQQLYATNGMLEHYHCQTLPMLLEELEEVYTDLSQTISESILSAASLLSNKAREQGDHYENICSTSRAVNSEADLANFIRTLSPDKAPPPVSHHPFTLPISENESFQMDSNYILQDVLVFDQLSLPPKPESLREEIGNLESQIRQLQESLDSLQRLQQRSLDSNLYNKANELQEDISLKRFDLQVAHIHHAAVKEQQKLFEGKARDLQENGSHHQERKASTSSTGTIKNKWLKAFRSLKSGGSSNSIEKSDAADRKSLRSFGRPETNTPSTLEPGQHIFQEYTYKKVTPCDFCREILRGHVRQGLKCKMCKMNVHVDCSEKTGRCQPKPRLLRRQKSTSDIDTNVLTPELEDSARGRMAASISVPQVDPIYQLLKQAGDLGTTRRSDRFEKDTGAPSSDHGGVSGSSLLTPRPMGIPTPSSSNMLSVTTGSHHPSSSGRRNQIVSAPHSPQHKKLSLRMKSLSLDSPESTEHVHRRRHHHSSQCSSHNQSPQSPVQSRRQLLTAKTVRMSSVDLPDENEKSLSSASTSPCPSPKPHRLLPTNLYVVLYNFRCRHQDELDLKAGCTVTVIDTSDPDWWQGKCLGKVGFFPSKYVTKLHPGERPLQVIHSIQLSNGESEVKLLRDQVP